MKKEIKKEMDIVFLLDRSGSMMGTEEDTIGGYNAYLKTQRNNNVYVTTILFNNRFKILHKRTPIDKVKEITDKEYYVHGSTALLDAIGKTIKILDKNECKKVIFIITTDGYENASRKYSKEQIKKLIKSHKNWEFIYIGADIDSYKEGNNIGISQKNISSYRKDKTGISKLFNSLGKVSNMFFEEEYIEENWKDDLENYMNNK